MENLWRMESWEPTCLMSERPSIEVLRQHSDITQRVSENILDEPYNPEFWLERAVHLRSLGFPELAAGDARKTSLLCKFVLSDSKPFLSAKFEPQLSEFLSCRGDERADRARQYNLQEEVISIHMFAEKILIESLHGLYDYWEGFEVCKEGKAQFPCAQLYQDGFKAFKKQWYTKQSSMRGSEVSKSEGNKRLVRGDAWFRPYPFMPTKYLQRPEQLVTEIQQVFKEKTSGKCTLSTSPTLGATKSEILGVVASSDIEAGTQFFRELALLVASSDNPFAFQSSRTYKVCEFCCDTIQSQQEETVSCEKCSATYCNNFCRSIACATYHQVLCGKDFSWLYDVDKTDKPSNGNAVDKERAAQGALWLRVIALCVQEGCHPLESLTIARLTSQYEGKVPREWSLSANVDRTHRILEQLGIDIYMDLRYDTWVMQTIWGRIINNQLGKCGIDGRRIYIVGSLWCFYNHSCEPNAHIAGMETAAGNDERAGMIISQTTRPIKKGEEIFISYANLAGQNRALRQRNLQGWLPDGCRCTKCERGE